MDRRSFLKVIAATAGTAAVGGKTAAARPAADPDEDWAVLVDLTRCAGCRMCEAACAEANGLPEPDWSDDFSYASQRKTSDHQWSVVNRFDTRAGEVFVKRQCMHCLKPACAAGCLTKALVKTDDGPVVWNEDRCMGCRYCMISCPFDAPKFEYGSANPKIQKCQLCWQRLEDGGVPACVENCPNEALTFGKRSELLREAWKRVLDDPDSYHPHVYGEREAGGTSWLYVSPVPFDEVGFRTDLGEEAYPERTRNFLTAVPFVLVLWPAMLLALRRATGHEEEEQPPASHFLGAPTGDDGDGSSSHPGGVS